ncbi:unnamed protein product [Effrenium voratum]|nr:unnamed protein product [Effrenium voratum]
MGFLSPAPMAHGRLALRASGSHGSDGSPRAFRAPAVPQDAVVDPGRIGAWRRWHWAAWGQKFAKDWRRQAVPQNFGAHPRARLRARLTQQLWEAEEAQVLALTEPLAQLAGKPWAQEVEAVLSSRVASVALVLDGPTNLRNAWTCLRTMDSFGLLHLELIGENAVGEALALQPWVLVRRWQTASACLHQLRREGREVWALEVSESARPLDQLLTSWTEPPKRAAPGGAKLAFVLGSEYAGVSEEARDQADGSCLLPMEGMCISFNLAVACAVLLASLDACHLLRPDLPETEVRRLRARWLLQADWGCKMRYADARAQSGFELPVPRRIERASMPVRPCPRTELTTLRQEVRRMHQEAEHVAKLKARVEVLKTELRSVLDQNRRMSDLIEAQGQERQAEDQREKAARKARHSQLDCARQLFRAMLDANDFCVKR